MGMPHSAWEGVDEANQPLLETTDLFQSALEDSVHVRVHGTHSLDGLEQWVCPIVHGKASMRLINLSSKQLTSSRVPWKTQYMSEYMVPILLMV
jgi:hypothetical protein